MHNKFNVLLTFAGNKKGIITGAFLSGLLSIGCTVLIPLFIGEFYQLALHTNSVRGHLFESIFGNVNSIQFFFLLFAGLLIIRFLFNFLEKYYAGVSGEAFSNEIRKQLFSKQIKTQLQVFESREVGSYLLRYSGDLKAIQNYLTKGLIQFLYDCVLMIAAISLLLLLQWELTVFLFGALPLLFLINYLLNNNLRSVTQKQRNLRSKNLAFVTARLKAIVTVKLFNRENVETEKFNSRSDKLYIEGKKYYLISALMQALYPLLLYCTLLAMLWFAYFKIHDALTPLDGPALLTFIMLVLSIIPVYKRILKVNLIWISGSISFNKLLILLNAPEEEFLTAEKDINLNGHIRFSEVTYGYNHTILLQKLSFEIEPGTIVRISGEQGSGKSTIFKLITGLYNAESGTIAFDNRDIKSISRQNLRKNIVIVSDVAPILGSHIFEVISYSRKEKKRKAALDMLKQIGFSKGNADELLDYPIKDGGRNLSAGQRKLLMLARAFLTNKKIILLDEPFADLDENNKNHLIHMLNTIKKEHTIIIIEQHKIFPDYDNQIFLQSTPF